jgi:hypothetical protein
MLKACALILEKEGDRSIVRTKAEIGLYKNRMSINDDATC